MKEKQKKVTKSEEYIFNNDSVKQLCLSHGKLLHVKKNTVFFDETIYKSSPYAYYLVEGVCSISGISLEGQEQTFLYQMPGEMIGHIPYILSKDAHAPLYSYRRPSVISKTDCTVYKISAARFVEYMEADLQFSNYLNRLLAHNYSMALAHLKQVQEDPSTVIICRFLLQMGLKTPEGPVVPRLFTYHEISTYFGIHEVTVSRIIGRLKQEGHIKRIPAGLLILNKEKLQEIILNEESFKY